MVNAFSFGVGAKFDGRDATTPSAMTLLDIAPAHVDATTTIAVFRYRLDRGESFGLHDHPQHQLTWSPNATLVAETPGTHWELPPGLALWIPGGVEHDFCVSQPSTVLNVKFNQLLAGPAPSPTAVRVSGLLGELAKRLADPELADERRRSMETVLLDELVPLAPTVFEMPMPVDRRARAVAQALIVDPADGRTLAEWGSAVGASERTLIRLFAEQTGLTFTAWRTQLRLGVALELLDDDCDTSSTARRVGYANVGAFIDMFRRSTGATPGQYRRRRRQPGGRATIDEPAAH